MFKKLSISKKVIFAVFVCVVNPAKSEKPPESVMRNIDSLSTIHAALSLCVNGVDKKYISANESYARRQALIEIEELVHLTETHYKTEILYPAFITSSVEYQRNQSVNSQIRSKYTNSCSTQLFADSKKILSEAKAQFSIFRK
jgi:hypothetical protein